MTMTYLYYNFY